MNFRLHLFEFEDQPWFPAVLRTGQMDYLRFMISGLGIYRPVAPLLAAALRDTQQNQLLELGAGAGGGTETVLAALRQQPPTPAGLHLLLTDLYPQPTAWADVARRTAGAIRGHAAPVNALAVPTDLAGFRVLFSAFHHFAPPQAEALLRDAVASGAGIGVFEGAAKSWLEIGLALTVLPVAQLLLTPFFRPFRLSRLVFTYLLPLIPLTTIWDGVVSILRMYPPAELRALAQRADPAGRYQWQAGQLRHWWGPRVTYLVGYPTQA
ncbi:class I SAM-dependent methyltransferase [Hymenobacter sp. HMF4947]|uniref:Class I SAM-dependent methyltransferase n=1 Tax=Hymenobacter ginkgonis TaxID=2682976 RepID=A0A7K1TK64_9BACT|nr:class I SAM-dependent methyltransferase [Hymenobacter ginkgonis]MVN78753.1 class I SAM-dependent methyltransferase [Hymenobacter ginkgonis]